MYKKLSAIVIFVFVMFSFSSCIKNFTCTCEVVNGNYTGKDERDIMGTNKTAEKECDDIKDDLAEKAGATPTCILMTK